MKIGLDIGATKTLGVVVDGDRRILATAREETEPGPEGVVRAVVGRARVCQC